jgi:hypothetical protein
MTGAAVFANAASLGERDHHASARLERLYILAHFFDYVREFVSQDRWELWLESDPSPVALP